jgi:hypothetical protein
MKSLKKTGHQAMKAWRKNFQQHKYPRWFSKACKAYVLSRDPMKDARNVWDWCWECSRYFPGLFDHYGTIGTGANRPVITQPYGDHVEAAIDFAVAIGAVLRTPRECGVWSPETSYYEFHPIATVKECLIRDHYCSWSIGDPSACSMCIARRNEDVIGSGK